MLKYKRQKIKDFDREGKLIVKVRAYVVHRKPTMIKFLLFGVMYHKKQYRVYGWLTYKGY